MNDPQAILITIAIGVGVLILVGGVIWGISVYARDQRRARSGRTEEYTPPPPPSLPERRGAPEAAEHPGIRWGDVVERDVAESGIERVRFGNVEQIEEYEYVSVNPYTFDAILKCPTCKFEIDENQDNAMICPNCDTCYHHHCWESNNNSCAGCGYQEHQN